MNDVLSIACPEKFKPHTAHADKIAQYYDIATPGYQDWSAHTNMHFGLYERGTNPLDRHTQAENTNKRVLAELHIHHANAHLLDMGCGVGATARFAIKHDIAQKVCGITLSPNQVEQALELSAAVGMSKRTQFAKMDFTRTTFPNDCFDGAYAIESACHDEEPDKARLLTETFRVLKKGSRVVLCDGFLKKVATMGPLARWIHGKVCKNWALGSFGHLDKVIYRMEQIGYTDIQVHDMTLHMLPSALHIPLVCVRYFAKLIIRKETDRRYWRHLCAPLWGMLLGMNHRHFGYYIISAQKPDDK